MQQVELYDTTLRDGNQARGLSFSLDDKLAVAKLLDDFGMAYIEAGWPNPTNQTDVLFFERARKMEWKHAKLCAFGSTRRPGGRAREDRMLSHLMDSGAPVIALFGKTWDLHVTEVLHTTLTENLDMITDSIEHFKDAGREVVFDAEHFFDGYKANAEYALETLRAALSAGADRICLCDTNGGMALPWELESIVVAVQRELPEAKLAIHPHNDTGMAVANALSAVHAGAVQVQGTVNGWGERCGNVNLLTVAADLEFKMGVPTVGPEALKKLRHLSLSVSEIANLAPDIRAPYVGGAAFAHKGGAHIDGVLKVSRSFEHIDPAAVGNERELIVSEQSGGSLVVARLANIAPGLDKKDPRVQGILKHVKDLEGDGWHFEAAEASFQLLAARQLGLFRTPFEVKHYRVFDQMDTTLSEATLQIAVNGEDEHTAAMGDGPVGALDAALRKAVAHFWPILQKVRLSDYKVRVLDDHGGTGARVRVLVESTDGKRSWSTIGVSCNIVEASWQALVDSLCWPLMWAQLAQKQDGGTAPRA